MKRVFCDLRGIIGKAAGVAVICCCVLAALWGCNAAGGSASSAPGYFDLEALVEEQIKVLSAEKPEVEKRLAFDGERDTLFTHDADWKDDLAFFFQAGINKPALNGVYSVTKPDSLTELYQLTNDGAFHVRTMNVSYSPGTGEVVEVKVNTVVEGLLFNTRRTLELKLDGAKGNNRLLSYEIRGEQQLRLGKKKNFEIAGLVR